MYQKIVSDPLNPEPLLANKASRAALDCIDGYRCFLVVCLFMTYLYSVNMPFRYAILMPQLTTELSYVSYLFALQCIISYSLTALLAPLYKFFMSLRFSTP